MSNLHRRAQKVDSFLGKLVNRAIAIGSSLFIGTVSYLVFTADDFNPFSIGGFLSICIAGIFAAFAVYMWTREHSLLEILADQE